MDREILRFLYGDKAIPKTTRQIARRINITPPAVKPRLVNLKRMGVVKRVRDGDTRTFSRKFGNKRVKISSPSKIFWGLDLK